MGIKSFLTVGKMGGDEMGIGKMGVGKTGVGKMGTSQMLLGLQIPPF